MTNSLSKMVSKTIIQNSSKNKENNKNIHKLSKDKYSQFLKDNNLDQKAKYVSYPVQKARINKSSHSTNKDSKNIKRVILSPKSPSKKVKISKKKKKKIVQEKNILEIEEKMKQEKELAKAFEKAKALEKAKAFEKKPDKRKRVKEKSSGQVDVKALEQNKKCEKQEKVCNKEKTISSLKRKSSRKRSLKKKEKSRKLSFYRNQLSDKDIKQIQSKIQNIKNQNKENIKKDLLSSGIRVSGKSDGVLRDIYMYTKICDFKINFEK